MSNSNNVKPKSWQEFRESGLLWWINRTLHLFGWAIVYTVDLETDQVLEVYPARVKFRGFSSSGEEEGFIKVTKHLRDNIGDLEDEANS